jgi:Na+/phosphate symporter
MSKAIKIIETGRFENIDSLREQMAKLLDELSAIRKAHIKRIKISNTSTRVSMLYLDILAETKSLVLYTINIVKTSYDFSSSANKK